MTLMHTDVRRYQTIRSRRKAEIFCDCVRPFALGMTLERKDHNRDVANKSLPRDNHQ